MKASTKGTTRLVLLDSHAIIHRAYHALPSFSSSDGKPTGALYGLSSMILRILSDLNPDFVIACYDRAEKTFRHEAYTAYKAGRRKAEDDLVAQLESSRSIFEAFGIPIYDKAGYEADDMLGTIVEQMKDRKDVEIIIASGDMDTMQLVDKKRVQVYTLKKGINDTILYDEAAVVARYGFAPEFLPDYKGLRGDPSDNIIGIKGIGEKTATELISHFKTIEAMYKALAKGEEVFKKLKLTDRIIGLIRDGKEEALFSKSLATIRRDAPISFTLPKPLRETIDGAKVKELFITLEFRSLLSRFEQIFGAFESGDNAEEMDPQDEKKLKIALSLLNSEMSNPNQDDIRYFEKAKTIDEAKKNIETAIARAGLSYVYEHIELPLLPIVGDMETRGIRVDIDHLKTLSKEFHARLELLEKEIYTMAGKEFNINSPKQLGDILFDDLAIGKGGKMKKTAGGARSTNIEILKKYESEHEIIPKIMEYRELQKLVSTYIDALPEMVKDDGRIHSTFNQMGAATGRFSSNDPNLQNIPIKGEYGKTIRDAFVAEKGHTLLSFDYSQIELRIAAVMSGDVFLKKVFQEGKDVHASVASKVFGVPENEVTPDMRRKAKVINFGIVYGMGVTALQANLGSTRDEAAEFYKNYFEEFPTIAGYLEGVKKEAHEKGYTETLFGRRRFFPALRSKIPYIRAAAERMAINAPIQGTAADCIKLAIVRAKEALEKAGLLSKTHLLLQVHDELVYEVEDAVVQEAVECITTAMETVLDEKLAPKDRVPLSVHVGSAKTWGSLKD